MNVQEILAKAQDTLTVKRVYGVPFERTVSRSFRRPRSPAAFVIKDGEVHWEPAIDATRLALRGMLIPIVAMIVGRSIVRTVAKRRR